MSYKLILNSSNVVGVNNSQFLYTFKNGCLEIEEGSEMCITQITIPYSWYNINSTYYNNASISYRFYYGSGSYNLYTVSIANGYYTIDSLNTYLQQYMISQNQYFTNTTTGLNLFYIYLLTNTTYYSNQFILSQLPTSLPSGYTAPTAGFNYNNSVAYGYCNSGSQYTPQIVINSNISLILGFSYGTYPSVATTSTNNVLSNITPNLTPVNSVVVRCNLINNNITTPSDILTSFAINGTDFGSNIQYFPNYEQYVALSKGTYSNLLISFQDQTFNQIQALDSNVLICLMIKTKPKPIKESVKEEAKKKEENKPDLPKLLYNDIPDN